MEFGTVGSLTSWSAFAALVVGMLALDLGVVHRKGREGTLRQALLWSGAWIGVAMLFGGWVTWRYGGEAGAEFFTGYVVEKSLSVDNVFVFLLVFGALGIPAGKQGRVLFWGVLSAIVLRTAMIFAGIELLEHFHFLIFVFAAILVLAGLKLLAKPTTAAAGEARWLHRLQRWVPSTPELDGDRFLTRRDGAWLATPMLIALLGIEGADIVFAVDSIPAVLAVTDDPFIVVTSNLLALLGLRALFLVLTRFVQRFTHLHTGLAVVLLFVGGKMAASPWIKVPTWLSLLVILGVLAASVGYSIWEDRKREKRDRAGLVPQRPRTA
jgi:tellurite resistance protein TerC